MRKIKGIAIAMLTLTGAVALASCGKKSNDYSVDLASKTSYKVGILQWAPHDALDNATNGFKEELEVKLRADNKTVEFVEYNALGDNPTAQSQAAKLVKECDLVMGNATPAATTLQAAAYNEGKDHLPIVFTSVTDAVSAKLVKSNEKPGKMVTGTSDINPVNEQIELIKDLKGDNCKIGFLYNAAEVNSKAQCDTAKDFIKKNYPNIKTETATIPDASSISSVTTNLASKVDAIYIPTDNLLASNMPAVTTITNEKKVPVICGESSMVDNGGTFTLSISYYELGKVTGDMAYDIMAHDKSPSTMAVRQQSDNFVFSMNDTAIREMNITLSDEFLAKYNID